MTTVNTKFPTNLFVRQAAASVQVSPFNPPSLAVGQFVKAAVIQAQADHAVLEIQSRLYQAAGHDQLSAGQQLSLQVVKSKPQLEFRVLGLLSDKRLASLIPLLTKPFDWSGVADSLAQLRQQYPESPVPESLVFQLRTALQGDRPQWDALRDRIIAVIERIQQAAEQPKAASVINATTPEFSSVNQSVASFAPQSPQVFRHALELIAQLQDQGRILRSSPEFLRDQGRVLKSSPEQLQDRGGVWKSSPEQLQDQCKISRRLEGQPLPPQWYVKTRDILAQLENQFERPVVRAALSRQLLPVLQVIQQHPAVSPQLAQKIESFVSVVRSTLSHELHKGDIMAENAATVDSRPGRYGAAPAPRIPLPTGAAIEALLPEIKSLMENLRHEVAAGRTIPPDIVGRLEGMLARLQEQHSVSVPGLNKIETLMLGFFDKIDKGPSSALVERLGMMSLLFGFSLEKEILRDRQRSALNVLRSSLLQMQDSMPDDAEEPLRRLELFQLCRTKLSDEQVQFLPLPFAELEEGFLLAKQQPEKDQEGREQGRSCQMSLSLRLSALGDLRVDMLYDQQGLRLSLAGEDQEKKKYLETLAADLRESLSFEGPLKLSFSDDASQPAEQLRKRVLPDASGLLNTRV